jgi:hypothetical protein
LAQARVRPDRINLISGRPECALSQRLNPRQIYIREFPYAPVASLIPPAPARELGLAIAEGADDPSGSHSLGRVRLFPRHPDNLWS